MFREKKTVVISIFISVQTAQTAKSFNLETFMFLGRCMKKHKMGAGNDSNILEALVTGLIKLIKRKPAHLGHSQQRQQTVIERNASHT